jgi:hypothetical protein
MSDERCAGSEVPTRTVEPVLPTILEGEQSLEPTPGASALPKVAKTPMTEIKIATNRVSISSLVQGQIVTFQWMYCVSSV